MMKIAILRFNFLMPSPDQPVMTGHQLGTITLNASEADVVHREKTRLDMQENYRTVLTIFVMKVDITTLIS